MIIAFIRIVLTGVLFSLIGVAVLIGQSLTAISPVISVTTAIPPINPGQPYYIKGDSEVDAYSCPNIECDVATVFNPNTTVSVVGPAQGEALVPVVFNKGVVYVVDNWLSPKPVTVNPQGSGASATCKDGWTSYSANRRGTCSHHGGVRTWYK